MWNPVCSFLQKGYMDNEEFDKREKEGRKILKKNNVPGKPLQLSLGRRLEKEEEKMRAGKIASAEQVRGGCLDLYILLVPFSESLPCKGKWLQLALSTPSDASKKWVELETDPGLVSQT